MGHDWVKGLTCSLDNASMDMDQSGKGRSLQPTTVSGTFRDAYSVVVT